MSPRLCNIELNLIMSSDKIKSQNYRKGRLGEKVARKYLESKGYVYLDANYRNKLGEVDLIMKDGDWLVFVEVKFKLGLVKGLPEEMIDRHKIYQVRRVAECFCQEEKINLNRDKCRIDAVCIVKNKSDLIIRHYESVEL